MKYNKLYDNIIIESKDKILKGWVNLNNQNNISEQMLIELHFNSKFINLLFKLDKLLQTAKKYVPQSGSLSESWWTRFGNRIETVLSNIQDNKQLFSEYIKFQKQYGYGSDYYGYRSTVTDLVT